MLCISQLPWGLGMGLMAALQASAAPSVNVGMTAAFSAGPYLLELLETAAGENSTSYFALLDRIASGHFSSAKTEADLYGTFLDTLQRDGHITKPEALSTFNLALSLRSAAPRVEAHYQYYSTAVESTLLSPDCPDWVQLGGSQYCDSALTSPSKEGVLPDRVKHLPFDRTTGTGKAAVLYADPTSSTFPPLHKALREASSQGKLQYRLRYRPSSDSEREPLPVSGYGVELALKRTDYIVIDDRDSTQDDAQKPLSSEVDLDEPEEVADLKPLSTSELASLGMKAASFVLQNVNPFETLVKLTQDFPKFSASIASHEVSEDFEVENVHNRQFRVPPGINWLWMNGVQLIERQIEPFTLVEMIRRERKLINGVRDLGFNGKQAVSLLGHKKIASAKSDAGSTRYDWTDRLEDGRVIVWLNDLENDAIYEDYPTELTSLLQRTYPGQLPPIAKNIFNVIIPVDLTDDEDLNTIGQLTSLIMRGVPVRFGLVPLAATAESTAHAKIAYHFFESYGVDSLMDYLRQLIEAPTAGPNEKLFAAAVAESQLDPGFSAQTFSEVLEAESYEQQVGLAKHWARRLNGDLTSGTVFANGVPISRTGQWLQNMLVELTQDLQAVQKGVFQNAITDDTWVPGIFLEGALSKRNPYILPKESEGLRILDVNKLHSEHLDLFGAIPVLEAFSESTKENWAVLTVVADLSQDDGLDLLLSALEFKRNSPGVRLDVVHNPATSAGAAKVNAALKAQEETLANAETLDELKSILGEGDAAEDGYAAALSNFLDVAKIQPGTQVLLLNGRVVGPILPETPFQADDFQQLLDFEQKLRILPVYEAIDDLGLADKLSGPIAAAKVTSITALSTISDLPEGIFEAAPAVRTALYETWASKHTAIEVGDPESASIHIAGLLNPLSEQGQRWAPILKVLSELDGVYLKLFLNPKQKIEELPVKRFFRYVLEAKPSFDDAGRVKPLRATFTGLPSEALLTASMDVPPAWLVAPKASVHDLDNIKLSSVKSDVDATYELEHILIEGHSREGSGQQPPRGAQLVLGTESNRHLTDTIVMSNLGYFQFKANPGFYSIELAEGRSAEIYDVESIGAHGWAPAAGDEGSDVALIDFQGTTLYPRLKRRAGMEEADVLEQDDSSDDNIVAKGIKLANGLFGSSAKSVSASQHADINIFSVASGHLYERMLNIMMVSVMRHTKQTVKFWFIEQFLSPSFKDSIPHLAAAYGFRYEMVTYKWPHWLRQQTEKQREIWGYKILFLDVLFPLSLDKVIFVDADQVVRTDMQALVDTDLQGAPYAFTPMCDSRQEMDGFRFWKQGYWANYLRGRPYHISALYVVDLRRFRQLAAGDRLRQQYHALSADPASLANLDQDLPNHMQFQIPIHSLPQEWLWCETWCSDESLSSARTIDLCNNPQTKEPKLDRARRQVPEWTVYDDEIAAVLAAAKGLKDEGAGEAVNTMSRRLEEPVHTIDEL